MAGSRQAQGSQVCNFSTSQGKVLDSPAVEAFHHRFKRGYAGDDISLSFGIPP